MHRIALLIATFMLVVGSALAADATIDYPAGWSATGFPPHDTESDNVAIVAYQYLEPGNRAVRSLVIQSRSDRLTSSTEFAGKVFAVEYSADGRHLLVHQIGAPDQPSGTVRAYLLTNTGRTLWSKTETSRMYFFSNTGEAIYAWWPGDYNPEDLGTEVEIFALDGSSIRTVRFEVFAPRSFVVLGEGKELVVSTSRSVYRLDAENWVSDVWRVDLPQHYPDALLARAIGVDRFVLDLQGSAAMVFNLDGEIEYLFDPLALGEADSRSTPLEYAGYRLYTASDRGRLLLFGGTGGPKEVDAASSLIHDRTVNARTPAVGFTLSPTPVDNSLFFFASEGAYVRGIN